METGSSIWLIFFIGLLIIGCGLIIAAVVHLSRKIVENTAALKETMNLIQAYAFQDRQKSLITIHQLVQHSEFMPDILARFESSKTPEAAISTLSHEQRLRLRSYAIEVLLNLETMIQHYLLNADREENALFQIKAIIRQRYALWKALGSIQEANIRPEVRRFIEHQVNLDKARKR